MQPSSLQRDGWKLDASPTVRYGPQIPIGINLHLGEATRHLTNFVVRIFQDDLAYFRCSQGNILNHPHPCGFLEFGPCNLPLQQMASIDERMTIFP